MTEGLAKAERLLRRMQAAEQARELGIGCWIDQANVAELTDEELERLEWLIAVMTSHKRTHRDCLAQLGWTFTPPGALPDDKVNAELWRLIHALAEIGVYLGSTDHLSDKELYTHIWNEVLPCDCEELVRHEFGGWHRWFVCPLASPEEERLWLMYYATPEGRRRWAHMSPGATLPPRCRPPWDRDRHLPDAPS